MKQKIAVSLVFVLIFTTVLFAVLWQGERASRAGFLLLAENGAMESYKSFASYAVGGAAHDYIDGAASFKQFGSAYHCLTEGTNRETNYLILSEIYGYMCLSPDRIQAHIDVLCEALALLAEDITDENGYLRLSSLRHMLME